MINQNYAAGKVVLLCHLNKFKICFVFLVAAEIQNSKIAEEKPAELTEQPAKEEANIEQENPSVIDESRIQVDDFARLMSEFKGFSNSASKPEDLPQRPQVVGVNSEGISGHESSQATEVQENSSSEQEEARSENEKSREAISTEVNQDFQAATKSVGKDIKLDETQPVKEKEMAIAQVEDSRRDKNISDAPQYDEPEEGNVEGLMTNHGVGITSPEYLMVMHNGATLGDSKSPEDVEQESLPKSDSFSVFDETRSAATDGAESNKDDVPVKKLQNLKPKLPFPLLLVSAGEGHVDMRKKSKGDNGLEPRLLVWQMN